jgi:hypothetical protein
MKSFLDILQRIPAAFWAALAAGIAILLLVLRGRRLEAELAQAKVREHSAKAKAKTAEAWGKRAILEQQADLAAAEAEEIEKEVQEIESKGEVERKRLLEMPSNEVHKEYQDLAERAKARARKRIEEN